VVDENIIRWLEAKFEHFESYLKGIDKKCSECRDHCNAARARCVPRVEELEKVLAEKQGACDATKSHWYRNPHWWHSVGAWVAIGAALWMGARGGLH